MYTSKSVEAKLYETLNTLNDKDSTIIGIDASSKGTEYYIIFINEQNEAVAISKLLPSNAFNKLKIAVKEWEIEKVVKSSIEGNINIQMSTLGIPIIVGDEKSIKGLNDIHLLEAINYILDSEDTLTDEYSIDPDSTDRLNKLINIAYDCLNHPIDFFDKYMNWFMFHKVKLVSTQDDYEWIRIDKEDSEEATKRFNELCSDSSAIVNEGYMLFAHSFLS